MTKKKKCTIPEGYKQTEVGVIPDDWNVCSLPVLGVKCYKGKGLSKKQMAPNGKYKCIHYGELFTKYREMIKDIFSRTNVADNVFLSKENDVLMPTSDVTPNGLATASCIKEEGVVLGGDILVIRMPKGIIDGLFFSYGISQNRDRVMSIVTGTTVYHLYANDMKKYVFAIPLAIEEQTAIAEVLSDTDELIESLEKLIVKKRAIKQGAMQELLTGKRRLPGFSGEWKEKELGKVCSNITTGKLNANAMVYGGQYRFYTCAKEYYYINHYAFDTEALLVSGNGANVGYIHYYKGRFNAYQRTYVLSDFYADVQYLRLYMDRKLQDRIRTEVNAGNTPYIKMGTLKEMSILLPATKEEQTAIAEVLSDMDAEIEALEQKLSKYKLIKTGMMQQLLTGKIRII